MKRVFFILIAAAFICFAPSVKNAAAETVTLELIYDGETHLYTAAPVRLFVNGAFVTDFVVPPIIVENYTLVPAREVFEPMNAQVDWAPLSNSVFIHHKEKQIILRINDKFAIVNGVPVEMPVAAKIINDKMMIPLRFVADSLDFLVFWDDLTRTAYVDDLGLLYNESGYAAEEFIQAAPSEQQEASTSIIRNTQVSDSDKMIPARDVSAYAVADEDHGETSIIEILTPDFNNNRFIIRASSAISGINSHLLYDNRMYIDIFNSAMMLAENSFHLHENPSVASVRAAQNQITPEMITRVVFDLKDGAEYNISISPDRKEIYVGFVKNIIYSANFFTEGASDVITISAQTTPYVSVYPSPDPNVLFIDIPYAAAANYFDMQNLTGRFVRGMALSQFDNETARLAVTLTEGVMYEIKTDAVSATVRLSGKTFQNIEYDFNLKRLVIKKDAGYPMSISNFIHTDNYSSFSYTIHLGGDYGNYLGNGDYVIRDQFLNSIHLRSGNDGTYLTFNETAVYAFNVYEDNDFIYIQPVHPKQKHGRVVIIDPGHGGGDEGTNVGGILEKNVNLDISNRVVALFNNNDWVKAYATRTTDIYPDLDERVEFGGNLGDLYVSIHNNFAPIKKGSKEPNPEPSGTETFYYPTANDEILFPSEIAAGIIHKNVVRGFGSLDRGLKQNRYLVLDAAKIPAVLIEVGFLSNPDDRAKLVSDAYKQRIAEAIYAGILEVFEIYRPAR